MKIGIVLLGILIYHSFSISAQNPNYQLNPTKNLNQYNYDNWSTTNNLPTNSLLHIYQSKSGYIWLSGYGGLIRFDGNKFAVFNKNNTDVFTGNITGRIAEDSLGTLWITTQESGLISLAKGKFTRHGKTEGLNYLYRALLIDKSNTLWSASSEKGWFSYCNGKFEFIKYPQPLKNIEVRDICEGKNGEIYFGTLGEGLFKYQNGKLSKIDYNKTVSEMWIYSLYFDSENMLWVGTSEGLKTFNGEYFTNIPTKVNASINAIVEENSNTLWLGSKDGIMRLNKKTNHLDFIGEKGLAQSFINDMTFDKEGNLWLTFYKGGMTRIKDGKFTNYSKREGLSGKVVNAICEIDSNVFLVGFDYGKINIIEKGIVKEYKTQTNIDNKRVRHIQKDSKNNIWISTYDGLLKIDPKGNEKLYKNSNGFNGSKIRLTFEDNKGNIWIATRNNGAVKLEPNGTIKNFSSISGLNSTLVMSIDQGADGKIYIGTNDGGVNVIENDTIVKTYNQSNGLPSNIIFDTHQDAETNIWIALNGGLACIYNDTTRFINFNDGLADESPFSIVEDDYGNLWMPCSQGIMKIKKQEILDYFNDSTKTFKCRLYNSSDGMLQEECNATSQSILASDGSLLFSTINGIARINPTVNQVNKIIPNIIIEKLKVNGKAIILDDEIIMDPGKKRLTFEYTSLSLHEPQKNEFKYRLKGYEDNWEDSEGKRIVSYTNLSPGQYTFSVIGSNNDGVWNTNGDSISFIIKPHFFQTRFFYALLFTLIFLVAYLFYYIRVRKFKNQQKSLEMKVQYRTREISTKNQELEEQKQEILSQSETLSEQKKELEDALFTKNKLFSIIAHDLRSPMGNFKNLLEKLVEDPESFSEEKRKALLVILADNAKSTFSLLENLLNWSMMQMGVIGYNPITIKLYPLVTNVLELLKPFAIKKNISITVNIESEQQAFADENMVRTIFRNLIMNAIKFTRENGSITISTHTKGSLVEISIKDNGIGINEELKNNIFKNQAAYTSRGTNNELGSGLGLLLCKDFVERNTGTIWVESAENVGSTFYFTLNNKTS